MSLRGRRPWTSRCRKTHSPCIFRMAVRSPCQSSGTRGLRTEHRTSERVGNSWVLVTGFTGRTLMKTLAWKLSLPVNDPMKLQLRSRSGYRSGSAAYNKQLQRTVKRYRGEATRAPFHYARVPRLIRQRAAAELRRYIQLEGTACRQTLVATEEGKCAPFAALYCLSESEPKRFLNAYCYGPSKRSGIARTRARQRSTRQRVAPLRGAAG